jgi:hypothetical protein
MGTVSANVQVYTDTYNRLAVIPDTYFEKLSYTLAANAVSTLTLTLPADFNLDFLAPDNRLQVWFSYGTGPERRDIESCWIIRYLESDTDEQNDTTIRVIAESANALLKARTVAYNAGSSQAQKTANADDMLKAIVRENFTAATDTTRNYAAAYFAVAADLAAGPSLTKGFSRELVLETLQEICEESFEDGTPLYFDFVENPYSGLLTFTSWIQQRGIDRTANGPVLSMENGTLETARLIYDYRGEVTRAYVGGSGQNDIRIIGQADDTARQGLSIFALREKFVSDTNAKTEAVADSKAAAHVRNGRPRRTFTGRVREHAQFRYGTEWGFGDRFKIDYAGLVLTCRTDIVNVTVANGERTVTAELRAE